MQDTRLYDIRGQDIHMQDTREGCPYILCRLVGGAICRGDPCGHPACGRPGPVCRDTPRGCRVGNEPGRATLKAHPTPRHPPSPLHYLGVSYYSLLLQFFDFGGAVAHVAQKFSGVLA